MKLICLTFEMLLPANSGGRIYSYMKLKTLAKNHQIYLYSVIDSDEEKSYKDELLKDFVEVHLYNRNDHKILSLFKSLKYPFPYASRIDPRIRKDIDKRFSKGDIDYVLVDMPQVLGNISERIFSSGHVVVNQQNIEHMALANIACGLSSPIKKIIYRIEAWRLKRLEYQLYHDKPILLHTFVSNEDKAFFENEHQLFNTSLLAIGSNIHEYEEMKYTQKIMFFGKMSYPPNAEGAKWFIENVFAKIQAKYTDVHMYVVGKDPSQETKMLQDKYTNVHVTGTVDDVEPYYRNAQFVVVPISHGGGVKVKVMDALGYGKLIVTTEKGIEGTEFKNECQLLVAKDADSFCKLCVNILENPQQYEIIRKYGYEYVKEKYSWNGIIEKFERDLMSISKQK